MKLKLILLFLVSLTFLFFSYESLGKKEEKMTLENFIKQYTDEALDKYSEEINATKDKLNELFDLKDTPMELKKPTLKEKLKKHLNNKTVAIASLTTAIISLFLFFFMGKGKQCEACKKYTLNPKTYCTHCGERL